MSDNQAAQTAEPTEADIKAAKELAEAIKADAISKIKANFDNKVDPKDFKFHFKKVEVEVDGKKTGDVTKRPTVELTLPIPSVEGIVAILEAGGAGLVLLLEAVQDVVVSRAREIINDKEDITQASFPIEDLAWDKIASLPKAERRGGGISKEIWDAFSKDYIAVMPGVTGKTAEQVGNAAKILLNKFNAVKTNKPVLKVLKEQLGIYVQHSTAVEEYTECVEFLLNKAETLINTDEAELLKNL